MILRQIAKPMPMPLGLMAKNASNNRLAFSGSIPTPESWTETST
jgi:hypothetical protein